MPNQLDNLVISGQTVSVIFPLSFTLPKTAQLTKVSDHELQANITYTVKMFGLFTVTRTGSVYYNLDTGTIKLTP